MRDSFLVGKIGINRVNIFKLNQKFNINKIIYNKNIDFHIF